MALLDHIILLLGPTDGDLSMSMRLARDSALVLLLLDGDALGPGDETDIAMPIAVRTAPRSSEHPPGHGPDQETPVDAGDAGDDPAVGAGDWIAEIAGEADRAVLAAVAERRAR